jgi:hypothetical protein
MMVFFEGHLNLTTTPDNAEPPAPTDRGAGERHFAEGMIGRTVGDTAREILPQLRMIKFHPRLRITCDGGTRSWPTYQHLKGATWCALFLVWPYLH